MPTYQYACKDCGHQFEIVQSFSDSSLTECPECHGTLRKQFGAVGVIFKGSGFYRNDSRSNTKSSPATPKAEKTGADNTAGKTETTTKTSESAAPASSSATAKSTTASTAAAS